MSLNTPSHNPSTTHLGWDNVALAFSFLLFDALLSTVFKLGVGFALITAGVRCVVQLAVVALILQRVFETENPWAVAGIAFVLNFLGTFEAVANKSKRRYDHMFPVVLIGMLGSTVPVSIIGIRFAMSVEPFWKPSQYIPMLGMLAGNTMSGIVVSTTYVLKELNENRDKIETYLAFGASRMEACAPIAKAAVSLALTPTINQMSVLGIIAIPGMMSGALLGGASVEQAAKLQMSIMFMIAASSTLATIFTTVCALSTIVDGEHRLRPDRVDSRPHAIWRARNWVLGKIVSGFWAGAAKVKGVKNAPDAPDDDRDRLLG